MDQPGSSIKKMTVVAIPTMSSVDWDYVQGLRKRYDAKGHAFIEPHFTLFSTTKPFPKQKLRELLGVSLIQKKRIYFSLRTVIFMPPLNRHKSWYAFLIPTQGFNEFIKLHRHVYTAWGNAEDENFFFIPHITIGSFQCKTDCLQLVNELNAAEFELSGYVEKISLIEESNNSAYVFDQIILPG